MTSQACSTAGVSRTNRRATAFSACSNSVSTNATTWAGGDGTSVTLGADAVTAGAGGVASDAIRTLASETRELRGKRSTKRVSVETSLVALRNDHAISAASGGGVASTTAGPRGGDLK